MRLTASPWWLVLSLLGLALAFTFGTLHQGEWLYAPAKLLYHFEPWRGMPRPFELPAWDVLVWDGVAQFYIWRDLVRSLWLSGELPLWNPYALCGTPLLANSQSAPFYLPHLLVLPLPTALGMGVLAAFHLFWAGLGLGLWLWQRGLRFGALMGAVLWMFSLFLVAWLPLSSVPATISWFGWLLLGLERVRANGWRSLWAFSLPLGMMSLAGHLQFAFYGVLLSLLYALYLGYETRGQGGVGRYALAVSAAYLLGGSLAALQLLPALEFSAYSHRQAPPTEAGYQAYVRNALPLFHLIVAWFPDAYGNPRTGTYWGAVHYAELVMSVGGGFGLWLALMGIQRKGQSLFWVGIGLLALLIALGTPLTRLLYFYLPGFSATGSPARILCLWAFSVAVLAAYGMEHLERWWRALLAWAGLLALALLLAELTLPQGVSRVPLWEQVLRTLRANVLAAVSLFAIFAIGVALFKPRVSARTPHRWIFSGAGGLMLFSLAMVFAVYQAGVITADYRASAQALFPSLTDLPQLARGERIAVVNERWNLYEPPPARMPPNTPVAYRLPDVGGYDSLLPRHYKRFLDLLNGQDSAPVENGNMLFVKRMHPDLARLRVRAVLTPNGWQSLPVVQTALQPIEVFPDEEAVWQRLQAEPFPERIPVFGEAVERALRTYGLGERVENILVEWQEYRATYLRVRVVNPSKRSGWLLITDTWYPGWRATVNGKTVPLLQANGAFRAVPIPAGEAVVEMRFVHHSFWIGALLSAVSTATLMGIAATLRTLRYT